MMEKDKLDNIVWKLNDVLSRVEEMRNVPVWTEEDQKHYDDVFSGLKYAYEDLKNNGSEDSAKDIHDAYDWLKKFESKMYSLAMKEVTYDVEHCGRRGRMGGVPPEFSEKAEEYQKTLKPPYDADDIISAYESGMMEESKEVEKAYKTQDDVVFRKGLSGTDKEDAEHFFPDLRESEDERIRKHLVDMVKRETGFTGFQSQGQVLAYLEKQKERGPLTKDEEYELHRIIEFLKDETCPSEWISLLHDIYCLPYEKQKDASKAIEAVDRIDKYIDEHLANAHDMKDSNPDKKYYRGWDDALGKMAGILQDVYSGEKQKESLRDFIDDFPYSDEQKEPENISASTMIPSCWNTDSLEEEVERYFYYEFKDRMTNEDIAYHFANWQRQKDLEENPKSSDSIPPDCVSNAKGEDRWHKVKDSLPDNTMEVLCKDAIGNYFIGRYYSKGAWEISMYDDCDKSNEDNPPVVMWIDIPSEKQKEQKPLTTEETELNSIAFLEQMGYTCIPPKKEQKPAEKQDYSGLNDLERAIHRGFLSAGVENVPVTVIKETAKECLAQMKPAEWSPTKEQMVALSWAANGMLDNDSPSAGDIKASLRSLYNDLQSKSIKPAEWSEDIIQKAIKEVGLTQHQIDWFKTNVFPPKQEWSEEDEGELQNAIDALEFLGKKGVYKSESGYDAALQAASWLKLFCLQPKSKWNEDYLEEDIQTRFAFYTYKDDPSTLYLSNVFVEETSRNKGFGTKILMAAENVAETLGAISIRLKVKQDNPANVWYLKHGYNYITSEGDYDWLEKNLKYLKPKKSIKWSGDDELMIESLIAYLKGTGQDFISNDMVYWLKSLPERFNLQPKVKWSEKDERMKNRLINRLNFIAYRQPTDATTVCMSFESEISWLKSLSPQSNWKPTKEQMDALRDVIETIPMTCRQQVPLESLYSDLNKNL